MTNRLDFAIKPQPDDQTCGPTCLQALYRYYGDEISLPKLVREIPSLESGGTLAGQLALHALARGYRATIATYNLVLFDPTWFRPGVDLDEKLRLQAEHKTDAKLNLATGVYRRFLAAGGTVVFEDGIRGLLKRQLAAGHPTLTGLSSTYLYRSAREFGPNDIADDVRGTSAGHFVVLTGYDAERDEVRVADPYLPNPVGEGNVYDVSMERLIGALFLGVLTYDANLLFIEPVGAANATADEVHDP